VHDSPSDVRQDRWPLSSANVWAGHSGVLATTHYDSSHNYVVQVFGRKRWLLWPPSELAALRLHPSTHPSRRQTRMQLVEQSTAAEAASLASGYTRLAAHQEVLGPGEVLYVPPFWAHAVLTEEAGLSLSFLSASWLEATWARADWIELPLAEMQAGVAERTLAVALFLRELLRRCNALRSSGSSSGSSPGSSSRSASRRSPSGSPRAFIWWDVYAARHARTLRLAEIEHPARPRLTVPRTCRPYAMRLRPLRPSRLACSALA
jgi:hypothetical protein